MIENYQKNIGKGKEKEVIVKEGGRSDDSLELEDLRSNMKNLEMKMKVVDDRRNKKEGVERRNDAEVWLEEIEIREGFLEMMQGNRFREESVLNEDQVNQSVEAYSRNSRNLNSNLQEGLKKGWGKEIRKEKYGLLEAREKKVLEIKKRLADVLALDGQNFEVGNTVRGTNSYQNKKIEDIKYMDF